jgi:hypothetical protein
MTNLADTEARRRILTEFGTSFFVVAAAWNPFSNYARKIVTMSKDSLYAPLQLGRFSLIWAKGVSQGSVNKS